MTSESQAILTVLAIAVPLNLAGIFFFHRVSPAKAVRVLLGVAMLIAGVALVYPLMRSGELLVHPVRMGLAIAFLGVGFNQAAALLQAKLSTAA